MFTTTDAETQLPEWTGVQRPQRADARRNFDALIAAARDAFAEHGTDASLEDIARRAGVGIGTLYRNFPTRDALIEAVYATEVERIVAAAHGVCSLPPWEGLLAWLHEYVGYVGTKHVLLAGINSASPFLQSCRFVIYGAAAPLLERAQQAGAARDDLDVEDMIRLVSGVAAVAFPDAATRDRLVGVAIDGLRAQR